jgi:hypothetical protein
MHEQQTRINGRMRTTILGILLLALPLYVYTAPIPEGTANDGPSAISQVGHKLAFAWFGGNIEELDETLNLWWKERRRFDDGRFELLAFYEGLGTYISGVQDHWDGYRFAANTGHDTYPSSTAGALGAAIFWQQYAWNARGTGYADTVSEDGWKLYRERLARAHAILDESKSYASTNPLWYYQMLTIAVDESWSDSEFEALSREATRRYPDFFIFYFAQVRHLLPKWGGSKERFDIFVQRTVAATRATEGESMYARLYWSYDSTQVRSNLFDESMAEWPRMRKAFEDLMTRYPASKWNLNNFASFACRAHDQATFGRLIAEIGPSLEPRAWRDNYSYDSCKTLLATSK